MNCVGLTFRTIALACIGTLVVAGCGGDTTSSRDSVVTTPSSAPQTTIPESGVRADCPAPTVTTSATQVSVGEEVMVYVSPCGAYDIILAYQDSVTIQYMDTDDEGQLTASIIMTQPGTASVTASYYDEDRDDFYQDENDPAYSESTEIFFDVLEQ